MDDEMNYSFDVKFEGNILVVGENWLWQNNICTKSWKK